MTSEEKKNYLNVLTQLEPLFDAILKRSGQSWWSPPGEDWYFSDDMGCVYEFFDHLQDWLGDKEIMERTHPMYQNSKLMRPPRN